MSFEQKYCHLNFSELNLRLIVVFKQDRADALHRALITRKPRYG